MLAITENVFFACDKLIPAGGWYSEFEGERPASDLTTVVEDNGLEGPDCGSGWIGRGLRTSFLADLLFFSKKEKRREDSFSMQLGGEDVEMNVI